MIRLRDIKNYYKSVSPPKKGQGEKWAKDTSRRGLSLSLTHTHTHTHSFYLIGNQGAVNQVKNEKLEFPSWRSG